MNQITNMQLSQEMKRKLTGALLRYYREEENMTINFVAESLGINKGYLSEIERGRKEPSPQMLEKLTQFMDISFHTDESLYFDLRNKFQELYQLYIDLNEDKEIALYREILEQSAIYENSYAFFYYKLIEFMYNVHFNKEMPQEDFDSFDSLFNQIKHLFNNDEIGIIYDIFCVYFILKANRQLALKILKVAEYYLNNSTSKNLKAMVLYHYIVVYEDWYNAPKALLYCDEALKLFMETMNFNRVIQVSLRRASCYTGMRLYDDAEELLLETIEKMKQNPTRFIAVAYDNLAWNSILKKDYSQSLEYTSKAIEYHTRYFEIPLFKAYSLFKLDRFNECKEYIENTLKNTDLRLEIILFLKMLESALNKQDEAYIEYALQYYKEVKKDNNEEMILFILEIICTYYQEKEQYKNLCYYQALLIQALK